MPICPACEHEFESPDEDPFCSSCVDAGWDLAFRRGQAAARAEGLPVEKAEFKVGNIIKCRVTETGMRVQEVRWIPTYVCLDYQGITREYGGPGQLPSCEIKLAPPVTVGSVWYAPDRIDPSGSEWVVQELGKSAKQDPEGYVKFHGKAGWYEPGHVRLRFYRVR